MSKSEMRRLSEQVPEIKALVQERDRLKGEVEEWKFKYIDARASGYAEGREEQAKEDSTQLAELEAAIKVKDEALRHIVHQGAYAENKAHSNADRPWFTALKDKASEVLSLTPTHAKAKAEAVERLVEAVREIYPKGDWRHNNYTPATAIKLSNALAAFEKAGKP